MASLYGDINISKLKRECGTDVVWKDKDGDLHINLFIGERRQESEKGYTHFVKPNPKKEDKDKYKDTFLGNFKTLQYESEVSKSDMDDLDEFGDDDDLPWGEN